MKMELYTFSDASERIYEMFYCSDLSQYLWNKFSPLRLCLKSVTDLSRIKKKSCVRNWSGFEAGRRDH